MSRPFSAESVFRALAHKTRRRILESLRKGPRFASEVLEDPDLRMPTLSDHLRVLRQCGLADANRVWAGFFFTWLFLLFTCGARAR